MKSIAIVTPWFGKNLKGGAEQQAWQVATRLAQRRHHVEVLTTCCRAFQDDWSVNHFKPGLSQEDGIKIRRFKVDNRDRPKFDRINSLILSLPPSVLKPGVSPVSLEDATIFCNENINSTDLLNYLKKHQEHYQAFIFLPYLYGIILKGLPIVSNRAFLQPCLHDEAYAYLPQVANIFHSAKGLLFISEGEAQLARQLYGPGIIIKSLVAGAGVEVDYNYHNKEILQIKDFQVTQERFILCLGRRDSTKNTDLLIRAYTAFKQKHPHSNLKLVIVGPGNPPFLKPIEGLVDLGLVTEIEKAALLANCLALFQPSQNESYSRVIMEAWFYNKPVAAHRNCLATAMAVESAKGGWLAETEIEWTELFAQVERIEETALIAYGINGHSYAKENAVWDKIMERYEAVLGLSQQSTAVTIEPSLGKLKEIHQLLPNLAYGDAISNHALTIRNYLRKCGYKSDIFVRYLDERVAREVKLFQPNAISHKAGLIYHHSIGTELTDYAIAHPNTKCLIYHNITPAEFFLPYRPEFAKILEKGRAELPQLAQHFPLSVGDSAYNASDLIASGFRNPGVLPIAVDPSKWDMSADAELMRQLQDGKTNLLFVGRLAPNKCQDDLLEAFAHYLTMDLQARLILVGAGESGDPYYHHLINTIQKLNLADFVMLAGQVNDTQLLAYYRTAHLLWSMSEHEGFCVPLVEAMWFDVPVLAYKSTAVPETLGEAGLMFNTKNDLVKVAALAKLLVKDESLKSKVISAQRKRRETFFTTAVIQKLDNLILMMEKTLHNELYK
ncbi:glycosyltransferase family 4 protein [Pleurocapsales cyanobacterium LEGE 06147]|nr:glycosyltransferase family 4 protein [Pleurocapsales cyanobacterium LEGE 06147]